MFHLIFTIILAFCVAILLRYSERNRSQVVLAAIILMWILLCGTRAVVLLSVAAPVNLAPNSFLNFVTLAMGVPCFLLLLAYPIIIINPKLMLSRPALYANAPMVVGVLVYIIYHLIAGIPLNKVYSYEEAWAARYSVTIIMRLIITIAFIFGIIASMMSVWRLIPAYQKYIHCNYSDTHYNIDWLRSLCIGVYTISTVYFLYLFCCNYITGTIYIVVTSIVFISIMDRAIKNRSFDIPSDFNVEWSFKRGWYWVYRGDSKIDSLTPDQTLAHEFYEWIKQEKPYCNSDFSASRVENHIPGLNFTVLNAILQVSGYNFQSFVRKCRIEEAINIISDENNHLNFKEIAYKVGFNHYSSFCRAFSAEKGYPPSQLQK